MYTTCRLKWVDDDTEFVGTIKAFDCGDSEKEDECIFFYGLSKDDIEECIKNKDIMENEWQILEIISVDDSI